MSIFPQYTAPKKSAEGAKKKRKADAVDSEAAVVEMTPAVVVEDAK